MRIASALFLFVVISCYSPTGGAWSIDYSNGNGGFTSRAGTWSAGWRVQAADFDGDGYSDIFL